MGTAAGSGSPLAQVAIAPGAASVAVPDGDALFRGTFTRVGPDLLVTSAEGRGFHVGDYFAQPDRPALVSPGGAMLTGDVVEALAGGHGWQLAQAGAAGATPQIGRVESISGTASVQRGGALQPLALGDPVFRGDVLATAGDGKLGLKLADGTVFSLAGGARMVMNELVYDPARTDNVFSASLVEGSFVFITGQVAKTGTMRVQTPVASMGIRGTTPYVRVDAVTGATDFRILPDPDGRIGRYDVVSLVSAAVLAVVQETATGYRVESATSPPISFPISDFQQQQGGDAAAEAYRLFEQARQSPPGDQPGTAPQGPGRQGSLQLPETRPDADTLAAGGTQTTATAPPPSTDPGPPLPPSPFGSASVLDTRTGTPIASQEPAATGPGLTFGQPAVNATEDTPVVLSGFSFGPLAPTTPVSVAITAHSTITLASLAGLVVTGNGTDAVTLSGPAAAVLAALNGMTYTPTPDADVGGLTIVVSSPTAPGINGTLVIAVSIASEPDPPIAGADTAAVAASEDAAQGSVLANDRDPDAGDVIRVVAVGTGPIARDGDLAVQGSTALDGSWGRLQIGPDGTYTYTLDPDAVPPAGAIELFHTTISDSTGRLATATLTIGIDPAVGLVLTAPAEEAAGSSLAGGRGDDTLTGNAGNDTLDGRAGNDSLDGGPGGADLLQGGAGADTLAGHSGDTLLGGRGDDRLVVVLGNGVPDLVIDGGDGNDLLVIDASGRTQALALDFGAVTTGLGLVAGIERVQLTGGAGADALDGGEGNDTLVGGGGADTLLGGGGADSLWGGGGADGVHGSPDWLDGEAGDDTLDGGAGNDTLLGASGNDSLRGYTGDDQLFGGAGDDRLDGQDGADTLDGGAGANTLTGGAGRDVFVLGAGVDVITDLEAGTGGDSLDLRTLLADAEGLNSATAGTFVRIVAGPGGSRIEVDADGSDTGAGWQVVAELGNPLTAGDLVQVILPFGTVALAAAPPASGLSIVGTPDADTIAPGGAYGLLAGNDTILGAAGNDDLDGGPGNDSIDGGDDDDLVFGGGGNDTLLGGAGNDVVVVTSGNGSLDGGDDDDLLVGGTGNDTLWGAAGNDVLQGGDGNDVLDGGEGQDTLQGGAGDDVVDGGQGSTDGGFNVLDGGDGNDTLHAVSYLNTLTGGAGSDVFSLDVGSYYDLITDFQRGTGGDVIDVANLLFGIPGLSPDTASRYVRIAVDGTDGSARVEVTRDQIVWTVVAVTDAGGDIAVGDAMRVRWSAGAGGETVMTAIDGGGRQVGTPGNDTLSGGPGNDTLLGEGGNDKLFGGRGQDSLAGGDGSDTLAGGDGADTLSMGPGDSVSGGAGADVFKWTGTLIIGAGSAGAGMRPLVTDFDPAVDLIDVSAGTFSRNGGTIGDYVRVVDDGDVLRVEVDLDGPGTYADWRSIAVLQTTSSVQSVQVSLDSDANGQPIYETISPVVIIGGGDTVTGTADADFLPGAGTDDEIHGGAGADIALGLGGNDTLFGEAGADTLLGGAGDDLLEADLDMSDTLSADRLEGGDGNDTLVSYGGRDTLLGGAGDDLINIRQGGALVDGGDGTDTLQLTLSDTTVTAQIDLATGLYVVGGVAGSLANVEALVLIGGAGSVTAQGGDLGDVLYGSRAADSLVGGAGNDTLAGGSVGDPGDDGVADMLDGGSGNDVLIGGDGDTLIGGTGDDFLRGDAGRSSLSGGAGNDTLVGADGADTLSGGAGQDQFALQASDPDRITDFQAGASGDLISLGSTSFTGGTIADWVRVRVASDGSAIVQIDTDGTAAGGTWQTIASLDGSFAAGDVFRVDLGNGATTITASANVNVITGTTGNDNLPGTADADSVSGLAGNDTIYGLGGPDTLLGGLGNDQLLAGSAPSDIDFTTADRLDGGAGNDLLYGDGGADTLLGGDGDDSINMRAGAAVVDGGAGFDHLTFDAYTFAGPIVLDLVTGTLIANGVAGSVSGIERLTFYGNGYQFGDTYGATVRGGAGDDFFANGRGAESLDGGAGNDIINGNDGNDTLSGGADEDRLEGGLGNDSLDGGTGNDLLFGGAGADTLDGGDGDDYIAGHGSGTDDGAADLLEGGDGADSLYGGGGADTLDGGAGNDLLVGGAGADVFVAGTQGDGDQIASWEPVDAIDISGIVNLMPALQASGTPFASAYIDSTLTVHVSIPLFLDSLGGWVSGEVFQINSGVAGGDALNLVWNDATGHHTSQVVVSGGGG